MKIKVFLSMVLLLFTFVNSLEAYESENRLKTVIVGKIAKYIRWNKNIQSKFVITILSSEQGALFEELYLHKNIKSKPVEIKYIKNISDLSESEILFIAKNKSDNIERILAYVEGKHILSISDIRGFAQKRGMVQLYFLDRMLKIKINTDVMQEEGFSVDRTLLRVVDIVKKGR